MAMGRMTRLMAAAFAAGLIYTPAAAQQIFMYPTKGQSPEQQNRDRYECHTWAVQQTGFDPTNVQSAQIPATAAPPAQEAPQGGLLRGAARGAAGGAVGGAIAGDAGKGAAIGAATGALIGGFRRREKQPAPSGSWARRCRRTTHRW